MIKYFALYFVCFAGMYLFAITAHQWLLDINHVSLRFQLRHVYLFFASISFLICAIFKSVSSIPKAKEQIGFYYLPTIFLKGILFFLIFDSSIVSLTDLTKVESLNLLIPLFISLVLEVYFLSILLNNETDGIIKKI